MKGKAKITEVDMEREGNIKSFMDGIGGEWKRGKKKRRRRVGLEEEEGVKRKERKGEKRSLVRKE